MPRARTCIDMTRTPLIRSVLLRRVAAVSVAALAFGCSSSAPDAPDADADAVVEEAPDPDAAGVHEIGPNRYEVVIYAFEGGFDPREIHVPAGAEITFRARSTDPNFVHGLAIAGTPVEVELNGYEFTTVVHTFDEPGEYDFACYVYCGGGHPSMTGKIIVE